MDMLFVPASFSLSSASKFPLARAAENEVGCADADDDDDDDEGSNVMLGAPLMM
jgi:hypothetical protein